VKQAFTQGKRQAVIEIAKMKAKSTVKVGTQTERGISEILPKINVESPPAPHPSGASKSEDAES